MPDCSESATPSRASASMSSYSRRFLRATWVAIHGPNAWPSPKPAYNEYSRCECALTKPGTITASSKCVAARPAATSMISPPSKRTRPPAIGGPSTGSTQSAETSVIRPLW